MLLAERSIYAMHLLFSELYPLRSKNPPILSCVVLPTKNEREERRRMDSVRMIISNKGMEWNGMKNRIAGGERDYYMLSGIALVIDIDIVGIVLVSLFGYLAPDWGSKEMISTTKETKERKDMIIYHLGGERYAFLTLLLVGKEHVNLIRNILL